MKRISTKKERKRSSKTLFYRYWLV